MRFAVLLLASIAVAADWPRFRGLNGTGVADPISVKLNDTSSRLWKVEIPGKGNGSPIVVKGKIFLQCAAPDGSTRSLVCLDAATGKEIWTKSEPGQTAKIHNKSSLASGTPASDGKRIYIISWSGRDLTLVAYDFAGQELWREKIGAFESQHGAGHSPMVHAGKVFVNFDQDGAAEAIAFDAATGKRAWTQKRKAYRSCYSTPSVRELPNKASEVLFLSTAGLTAYDPASGKINWEQPFTWSGQALRSIACPIMVGDIVVCLTGDGGGSRYAAGVKPGPDPKIVWQNKSSKLAPYVPNPVVLGKHLLWVTDQGVLECINPLTGKAVWSDSAFASSVSASPILLGETLLLIDEKGKALTCKVDAAGFEKTEESSLGAPVFASPAAADGKLYIRAGTSLHCFGTK